MPVTEQAHWSVHLPVSVDVLQHGVCEWPLAQQVLHSIQVEHLLLQQRLQSNRHDSKRGKSRCAVTKSIKHVTVLEATASKLSTSCFNKACAITSV